MDKSLAYQILKSSLMEAKTFQFQDELPHNVRSALESIILGTHLTFRYILLTGILAKNVDPSIHTRALQVKAPLDGAYDARSLCHKVVVPFERDALELRL
jgi:hypothetical protein